MDTHAIPGIFHSPNATSYSLPKSTTSTPHPAPYSATSTPAPPSPAPATPFIPPSPHVSSPHAVKSEPGVRTPRTLKAELAPLHEQDTKVVPEHTYAQPTEAGPSARRKRKLDAAGYSALEVAEIESRAAAIDYAIALDQQDTLYAQQSRFTGFEDVVDRLLPWHIWQVPEDELILPSEEKDAADLAQASEQVCDLVNLRRRFAKARRREGEHPSDLPSLIYMLRESTAQARDELAAEQATLKSERGQYDALLNEQRKKREAEALKERMRQDEIERQRREQYIAQARAQQAQAAAAAAAAGRPPVPAGHPTPAPHYQPTGVPPQVAPAHVTARPPAVPSAYAPPPAAAAPYSATSTPTAVRRLGTPLPAAASAAPAPGTPTPSVRGRPRGRPRGSGRGGMRQTSQPHAAARPPAAPAKKPNSPVQITVAMTLIPAFVAASILILPNPQNLKAPATIVRTSDDRKNVTLSIDLGSCTQPQLQTLARLLNVQAKLPGANGASSSGTGSTTPNGAVASPAGSPATAGPSQPVQAAAAAAPPPAPATSGPSAVSAPPPAPGPPPQ